MRVRDLTREEDKETFQKIRNRQARSKTKIQRQTEELLESLSDQNKQLSAANLFYRKLLKEVMRMVPENLKDEIKGKMKSVDFGDDFEVHP